MIKHLSNIMHYVYVIKSKKNGAIYTGVTGNIVKRIEEHNRGKSPSTKRYIPWICVYIEGYFSEDDATRREMNLKYLGKAYGQLKGRIKNSLRDA